MQERLRSDAVLVIASDGNDGWDDTVGAGDLWVVDVVRSAAHMIYVAAHRLAKPRSALALDVPPWR
jgi:hypothetical protein